MGSSAKNYKPNGDTTIIGGVLNVVGDGQIQKDGVPVDLGGGGETVTWSTLQGKPSTFPPATHTHKIADIDSLQSELNDILSRLAALESGG